ncbi:MAG: hypothetical protein IJ689_07800 [Alphaproteobacteria bacterium]|nr:hypothetical protein [Alphaproteobacteria bacterium]MBR1649478.1 hypothetical protein [Alphaproteobacteria bacterium]
MNKYILMLGVAGVALGTYAAYAGNSATMTVTATIEHDVSLGNVTDLNMGTITINPADDTDGDIVYTSTGVVSSYSGLITRATNATPGTFTANIPNPSACTGATTCGGLEVTNTIYFGDPENSYCDMFIAYSGTSNRFNVYPYDCWFYQGIPPRTYNFEIEISYTPS